MNSSGSNTLDRIQREIKENLDREDELKNGHSYKLYNGNGINSNSENLHKQIDSPSPTINRINGEPKSNGFRRFTPNTKGVMQKFFKTRGKTSLSSIKSTGSQNGWINDAAFQPAKLTVEKGKPLRKGFVPTEEKIVKELQDFQIREAELRKERRKSQPNLMAALELEEYELDLENGVKDTRVLKPAKSMASLYKAADEEEVQQHSSAPCSLKPARSLAALCDLSDDEEMPGTYSLIMQFENMKSKEVQA
ncbi:hypothetical protein NQ317_013811 [Molorchus minor]|uniref:A-kinase anchor protein 2 C-terminal domain-containing protein n=1 Tax=Molorchus minor TaxID=1323400 RepID=A0ABQ9JTJ9_9CUCU|nr:hypothetical protein NQ317_013811 [Molorchus minor]